MKLKILFAGLILFALTLSLYSKANADPEKINIEYCITVDSQEAINIDIQTIKLQYENVGLIKIEDRTFHQLLNPGRIFISNIGKEVHDYNFIYTKIHINPLVLELLEPPLVGMKS